MCKLKVFIGFCFLSTIIILPVRCESNEEEPIPEVNDFEEAYRLFEYAKNALNPFASFPSISTTNKQIAEYLLLSGKNIIVFEFLYTVSSIRMKKKKSTIRALTFCQQGV